MTQEEKAKAYDEAIKKAKYFKNNPFAGYDGTDLISSLFPELKESEDEGIRKDIIVLVKDWWDRVNGDNISTEEQMIAWLEKQGETFTKKDVDDAYLKGINDTKNEFDKQYEATYQIRKDIATFIFNYKGGIKDRAKWMDYLGIKVSFAEKQGEQKPADKVEQKFKVGDFIVNDYCMGKVIGLTNDVYLLDTGQGIPFSCEHNAHLWTIQDAKDGDVLATEPTEGYYSPFYSPFVAIYKKQNGEDFDSYCFIGFDGKFYKGENGHSIEKIHPATKEQRDILFAKMKEAGYEWNAEKKELKKIEQKPAWSEEDKDFMYDTLSNLTELKDRYGEGYGNVGKCITWLKSLKERYT